MKVSVLIYTARDDHPYTGRPEMHCFEPVVETLSRQTFQDFELVISDALYEKRADYFREHPVPFPVKHVPSSPNLWHQQGRPGLCAQLNRGLAWCDGQLVWIGAENNFFPPHFLQTAWDVHAAGKVPVAWYAILSEDGVACKPAWKYPPVEFNFFGAGADRICDVDHRAQRFVDRPDVMQACHHQNYFAYAGLPLDLAYELNGFDEALDGDLTAVDVDMGSRIAMLRGDDSMAMHRDLWLMEPPTVEHWIPGIQRRFPLKCGYAIWWYNRLEGRTRVNTRRPEGWVEDVKRQVCGHHCPIRAKCGSGDLTVGERVMFPFCEGPDKKLTQFWIDNLPMRDLAADADARRRGEAPFDRFTEANP